MKIVVIDGQGGRIGSAVIEELKSNNIQGEIAAVGTNTTATEKMLKAKADIGATGENAVIVNSRDADYIIGPMGIVIADSLHGEISPAMSVAIGQSRAKKILIPISKCNTYIAGVQELQIGELVKLAVSQIG